MSRNLALSEIAKAARKRFREHVEAEVRETVRPLFRADQSLERQEMVVRTLAKLARDKSALICGEAFAVALFGSLAHSGMDLQSDAVREAAERLFAGAGQ